MGDSRIHGLLAIGLAAIFAFGVGLTANWLALMQASIHGGIWLVLVPSLFGVAFMAWRMGGEFAFLGQCPGKSPGRDGVSRRSGFQVGTPSFPGRWQLVSFPV